MEQFLASWGSEIILTLLTSGALFFCRSLYKQNKELKQIKADEQNRQYRQMILNEISPIIDEISKAETEIKNLDKEIKDSLQSLRKSLSSEHDQMYKDLNKVQEHNEENFKLIVNSYKFRLIQLCKTHLADNYITQSDFDQISEMYKVYHGLGGNGQAQEYYNKVLALDIKPNDK